MPSDALDVTQYGCGRRVVGGQRIALIRCFPIRASPSWISRVCNDARTAQTSGLVSEWCLRSQSQVIEHTIMRVIQEMRPEHHIWPLSAAVRPANVVAQAIHRRYTAMRLVR